MKEVYYFPLLFLRPEPTWDVVDEPPFQIARRLWQTSTFDLATLATRPQDSFAISPDGRDAWSLQRGGPH